MANGFLVFIITALISFFGSIQLGPVNIAVIESVLNKGFKPAVYVAIGGVIPELIYSWMAISTSGISFLKENIIFLQWLVVPFFIGVGIFNIFKKTKLSILKKTTKKNSNGIVFGFLLAFFNFQLFPFWLSIVVFFNSKNLLNQISPMSLFAFITGAAIGALGLLLLIAYLTNQKKDFFANTFQKYNLNAIFGCLFLIVAAVQIINLLTKNDC